MFAFLIFIAGRDIAEPVGYHPAFKIHYQKLLNVNNDGMKRVDVSSEILISRPVSRVASYACDPDNATAWYTNIKSIEWQTPRPLQVGSRVAFTARFLGRKLAYTYEIVQWVPNQKFVMRTADGPFPMETSYLWQPVSEHQTLMVLQNRGTPTGFSILFAPFMEMSMKKANQKDLARLKRLLETDP